MRYLRLVILLSIFSFGLNATVFAQICCPAGCVQDANRCVTTGPNPRPCNSVPCRPGSPGTGGGSSGGGVVIFPGPNCFLLNRTPAARDARTNQCVADLRGRAQLWGCMSEDDAGRAEDLRTGLTCPDRQAALANQCRARCAKFARGVAARQIRRGKNSLAILVAIGMGPRALISADLGFDPTLSIDCRSETGLTPGHPDDSLHNGCSFDFWEKR
jgi:hypothetical protein